MNSINTLIEQQVAACVKSMFGVDITTEQIVLQPTKKEFEGDITLVVFPFVKLLKKAPQEISETIGNFLVTNISEITKFNSVAGFLNLSVSNTYWLNNFNSVLNTPNFGFAKETTGKTYIVEYASPNTNKPLHLGHCRNIFLGYSVSEILKANGHEVVKTQIINDRGIHICKSMLAWQKFGNGETPDSFGLKGDKLVGKYYVEFDKIYKSQINELIEKGTSEEIAKKEAPILIEAQEMLLKWEQGDKEVVALWEKMNGWVYEGFNATYTRMNVDFDKIYYESNTYILGKDVVMDGLSKGVFFKKEDGSVWVDLTSEGLDEKLLLRGDGTSVYITQDIGTAIERYKDFPSVSGMIYTVGNEQDYHFDVLFKILKKLNYSWANNCYHLSYGMVDLPTGRMKSREGTVVDADDLMASVIEDAKNMTQERGHIDGMTDEQKQNLYETIGLGGLKYYLLRIEPKKRMQFNPEESVDLNGNTAPFIQYGYARIQSILRKGEINTTNSPDIEISETEKELVKLLLEYPTELNKAGNEYSPAVLCNYNYELIKLFNSFYQSHHILSEENESLKNFRLALCSAVADVTKRNMKLLGIEVPQKM